MALGNRCPESGLIHHSDQGVQYACHSYQQLLRATGLIPSMSRKGDCWDNAVAESFFSTLKTERTHHQRYKTRRDAYHDIFWHGQAKTDTELSDYEILFKSVRTNVSRV